MPDGRLSGRAAIVTGAGRGMGRAIAARLAVEGAVVGVNDVDEQGATGTCHAVEDAGGKAIPLPADVSDAAPVTAMMAEFIQHAGRIDIVVNNAGMFPWREDWTAIPLDEWDRVMAVNVRGAYLCARAAYPALRRSPAGRIINISSTTFLSGSKNLLHYVTSKAALFGLTRALASEVGDDNITVNAVATGRTLTEGIQDWVKDGHMTVDEMTASRQSQPIKRMARPEDVAAAAAFLASDDAAFVTGQLLVVDGGRNMRWQHL